MQQVDARLVTPEAVVLEFETAGVGSRILDALIDMLIKVVILIGVFVLAGAAAGGGFGSTPITIFVLIATFAVIFVYPAAFETLWRGRTPGKAALGMRVVTREGAPIRFRQAAIRSALWVIDVLLLWGAVGLITMLATKDTVRLGDIAAGTIVVRERTGARMSVATSFPVPQGCEAYVDTLDVSALSTQDYAAVRNFLLRAASLGPQPRWTLGRQFGTHVATRMHHRPPEWATPELFLACVAAAYQRRFAPTSVAPYPRTPSVHQVPSATTAGWGVSPPAPPTSTDGDFAPPG